MRDWLSHRVTASPDKTALVRADDGESWTYRELDTQVQRTAGQLAAAGVRPGDRVGILLTPSVGYVGLIHAVMRLKATLVPLGPRLTPPELRSRMDAAQPTLLVCEAETESLASKAADPEPIVSVSEPGNPSVAKLHAYEPEPVDPRERNPANRLCLVFTSGTTGEPKPVDLRYRNILASAVSSGFRLGIDPEERWLVTLSPHHMGGLVPVYRSVLYGTAIIMRDSFDPGGAADDINRHDVTAVSLVPTMLRQMLNRRGTLDDSLRAVLLGGAPCRETLIERCRDFSVPVYPTYGMTETASQIATADPKSAFSRLGTSGRPLMGTDVTVVDREGTVLDRGESGEFVISGPTVTPGYYDDQEATEQAFGEHGLHTGDIGYIDEDGYLHVLNRLDDRIISGGENVEPGKVATVLTDHPGVEDVAVVGLTDKKWGQRVGAQVIRSDPDLTGNTLLSFAEHQLAGFKLPQTMSFEESLPRTASGTVDREAVREHLSSHGFEPDRTIPDPDDDGFEQVTPEPIPNADTALEKDTTSNTDESGRDEDPDETADIYGVSDSIDEPSGDAASEHMADQSQDSDSTDNPAADTNPADE